MASQTPRISIVMGSDSDLPVMGEAAKLLAEFGITSEVTIVSAHRTPERLYSYTKALVGRGVHVVIAGAGGAAHLPGMIASMTPLPVIGVPVKTSTMAGLDSLFSIVQMPPGIPVATVAINGAKNAGLLAASILGTGDKKILHKVALYKSKVKKSVLEKAKKLDKKGFEKYLKENFK